MFIAIRSPIYECSQCGSQDVRREQGRNGHYYDQWCVCKNCGHSNKPDRTEKAITYEYKETDVMRF